MPPVSTNLQCGGEETYVDTHFGTIVPLCVDCQPSNYAYCTSCIEGFYMMDFWSPDEDLYVPVYLNTTRKPWTCDGVSTYPATRKHHFWPRSNSRMLCSVVDEDAQGATRMEVASNAMMATYRTPLQTNAFTCPSR